MAASVAGAARGPQGGGACVNFSLTPCFIGNLLRCRFPFLVYVKKSHVFHIAYDTHFLFVFVASEKQKIEGFKTSFFHTSFPFRFSHHFFTPFYTPLFTIFHSSFPHRFSLQRLTLIDINVI